MRERFFRLRVSDNSDDRIFMNENVRATERQRERVCAPVRRERVGECNVGVCFKERERERERERAERSEKR